MTGHRISVVHHSGSTYGVRVEEGGTETVHYVNVWPSDVARFAPEASPEELLEASFEFLLAREPKESILPRFDLAVIEQYFPEYPSQIGGLIGG